MGKEQKKRGWGNLRHKYKLAVVDETSYEEMLRFRLSRLHVLMALSLLAVIMVGLTTLLVAFTGLREFIPGYPDGQMRQMMSRNAVRVDSLEQEVLKRDRFMEALQRVLRGDDTVRVEADSKGWKRPEFDTIKFSMSEEERLFREEVEERERFNLGLGWTMDENGEYYHFFPPVIGVVMQGVDEAERHYGTDIVARSNARVSAVLDGVVVVAGWTLRTGHVLVIKHDNDWLSVYKHNAVLVKRQGDRVHAGEVIGLMGNSGEDTTGPHLHFELWKAGTPMNPEDFIRFE